MLDFNDLIRYFGWRAIPPWPANAYDRRKLDQPQLSSVDTHRSGARHSGSRTTIDGRSTQIDLSPRWRYFPDADPFAWSAALRNATLATNLLRSLYRRGGATCIPRVQL